MPDSAEPPNQEASLQTHNASASQPSAVQQLKRLKRNINAYAGETVDIAAVLEDCAAAARAHGWIIEQIPCTPELSLLAFKHGRVSVELADSPCIYISTGIHGDEPAGPLAAREMLRQNRWPAAADLWLLPCLNPTGFLLNRRENAQGLDLNREYLNPKAAETRAHVAWLEHQPRFDLCLCLHEDWEAHGFYVYELNPQDQPSLAPPMIAAVAECCPIDRSETIEGRIAKDGIIRPNLDPRTRPQWPESFYLITYKTRLSYTLEAPSDFPLSVRVTALVCSVYAALEKFVKRVGS